MDLARKNLMKKIVYTMIIICSVLFLSACGTITGSSHEHEYTVMKHDESYHWMECECKDRTSVEAHKGGEATSGKKAICSVCNAEYGDCVDEEKTAYIGEYVFHHINRKLSNGQLQNYNVGDYYFGTTLSEYTIYASIGNGSGNDYISYDFGSPVSVTCDFEILDEHRAVAHLDGTVDLFNDGNTADKLYFDITEIDGQLCFILKATHVQTEYEYYVRKTESYKIGTYVSDGAEDPNGTGTAYSDASSAAVFSSKIWEPGYVVSHQIKITNQDVIDLKFKLDLIANGEITKLAEVLDVYLIYPAVQVANRSVLKTEYKLGTITDLLGGSTIISLGENSINAATTDYVTIAVKMQESAGNEYQNVDFDVGFSIRVVATPK